MKYWLLVILILAVLVIPNVQAQTWKTLPTNISAGHPFLWVVESGTDYDRIGWRILSPQSVGVFHKVASGKWSCFFADTTNTAELKKFSTCGPSPFDQGSPSVYTWNIFLTPGSASQDYEIRPNDLNIVQSKDVNGNNVLAWITVTGGTGTSTVNYKTYKQDLSIANSGQATFEAAQGRYVVNMTLQQGIYYIVFDVSTAAGASGGTVIPINITSVTATQPDQRIQVDKLEIKRQINIGTPYTTAFNIQNPTNNTYTNLTIESEGLSKYLTIRAENSTLPAGGTVQYTVNVLPLENDLIIEKTFKIYGDLNGNRELLKDAIIDVDMEVIGESTPPSVNASDAPILSVSPTLVKQDNLLLGKAKSQTLTVRNSGTGTLGSLATEVKGLPGTVTATLDKTSIASNEVAQLKVDITPADSAGKKSGQIIVTSNGGSVTVNIDLEIFSDLSADIAALQTRIDSKIDELKKKGLPNPDSLFAGIQSQLSDAESSKASEDYANANELHKSALTQFDSMSLALNATPAPSGGGLPIIDIILIIIIIVLGFLFYKERKKGSATSDEGYEDEEYDDDKEEY